MVRCQDCVLPNIERQPTCDRSGLVFYAETVVMCKQDDAPFTPEDSQQLWLFTILKDALSFYHPWENLISYYNYCSTCPSSLCTSRPSKSYPSHHHSKFAETRRSSYSALRKAGTHCGVTTESLSVEIQSSSLKNSPIRDHCEGQTILRQNGTSFDFSLDLIKRIATEGHKL